MCDEMLGCNIDENDEYLLVGEGVGWGAWSLADGHETCKYGLCLYRLRFASLRFALGKARHMENGERGLKSRPRRSGNGGSGWALLYM